MPDSLDFTKMQGIGNDFVVIDNRKLHKKFSAKEIKAVADQR